MPLTQPPNTVKRWLPILQKFKEVRAEDYPLLAQLLDNQFKHIEARTLLAGETSVKSDDIKAFTTFAVPIIRNVYPHLGMAPLIGIQGTINGLILQEREDKTGVIPCDTSHRMVFSKNFHKLGVTEDTPMGGQKLTTIISNTIIRAYDNYVIDDLLKSAKKFEKLSEALIETGATWILASRNTVDRSKLFENATARQGSAFDEIYEGGYRSTIRPSGSMFGVSLFIGGEFPDDKILVGWKGSNQDAGYILGIGVPILPVGADNSIVDLKSAKLVSDFAGQMFNPEKFGVISILP